MVYSSLESPSSRSWSKVTHIAVILATVFSALVGIGGYVTFTGHTQGNWRLLLASTLKGPLGSWSDFALPYLYILL